MWLQIQPLANATQTQEPPTVLWQSVLLSQYVLSGLGAEILAPFTRIKFTSEIYRKLKSQRRRRKNKNISTFNLRRIPSAFLCGVWLLAKTGRQPALHLTNWSSAIPDKAAYQPSGARGLSLSSEWQLPVLQQSSEHISCSRRAHSPSHTCIAGIAFSQIWDWCFHVGSFYF